MNPLQELIDSLATNRDNPDPATFDSAAFLAAVEDSVLIEMETSAVDAATMLQDEPLTDNSVAQLEVLADVINTLRDERVRRQEASAALSARAQELASRITPAAPAAVAEPEAEAEVPAVEETPAVETAPVPVTAAARTTSRPRVDLAALRRAQPASAGTPENFQNITSTVTASSDLPGYNMNTELSDLSALSAAVRARFASFPIGSPGVEMRGGIAMVTRHFPESLVATGTKRDEDIIEYAADERRLPGGSLVAAVFPGTGDSPKLVNAKWCAPYEIDSRMCDPLDTLDGFIELPSIAVRPPGVIYPQTPPWWQMFDFDVLREDCEPCATAKPCISVPCPDWTSEEICVEPFCLESCILKERANQTWTNWFVTRAVAAFRRWQNVQVLRKVMAKIDADHTIDFTAPTAPVQAFGASHTVYDSLAAINIWYRDLYRRSMTSTMEVVAPHWLKEVIRSDMAKRSGCCSEDVSDLQINTWFANRGLNVQYVYDWQSLVSPQASNDGLKPWPAQKTGNPADPAPIQKFDPTKVYPATVEVLMFPAGTFVKGQSEMFRIDGLYDSANLKNNLYTKMFFEDGVIVLKRCFDAFRVKLPLCIMGAVGPRVSPACQPDSTAQKVQNFEGPFPPVPLLVSPGGAGAAAQVGGLTVT